jgi:tripartite-type tricarboxylate transporter receptor subunit TctC
MNRIAIGRRTLLALTLASPTVARAQGFPSRPISLVVGSVPGATMDFSARMLAEGLAQQLGGTVVVENRAGGNGALAQQAVARAPKDGHALLYEYSGFAVGLPALGPSPRLNGELVPIAATFETPHVFAVPPSLGVATLAEFLALVRSRPGRLNYGSPGIGSVQHLGMELLKHRLGLDMTHVPYRGSAPAITDLVAGRLDVYLASPPSVGTFIQAGTLRALAIASTQRHPALPDVPTSQEAGLPDFVVDAWFGIFAGAGTPAPIIARLEAAARTVAESPRFVQASREQGAFARFTGAAALQARMERELAEWVALARAAGIRPE